MALLEQAISLDSTFADAWAELSGTLSTLYSNSTPDPAVDARAKAAAERALALDPEGGKGQAALGYYWYWGRLDYDQALRELTAALSTRPNDADLIFAIGVVPAGGRGTGRRPSPI